MDVDASLRVVGLAGRRQIVNFLIFGAGLSLSAIHMTGITFTADRSIPHYCKPAPGSAANGTVARYVDEDGVQGPDGCYTHEAGDNGTYTQNTTICRHGWDYISENGETSATTDFDLVCHRGHLANLLMSCHFAGVLVGGVVTGQAADMFGRRVVAMTSLLLMAVLGTAISFTWNLQLLMALRFLLGVAIPGSSLVGYIRAVEMFQTKRRLLGHTIVQHFWSFGVMLVALFAYLFPDWRHFQLFTSLLCLPVNVLMWFFAYESLRWLVQRGRVDKAEGLLRAMAKAKNIHSDGGFLLKRGLDGAGRRAESLELPEQSNRDRASDPGRETPVAEAGESDRDPADDDGEKTETCAHRDEDEQTKPKHKTTYTPLDLFKTRVLAKHTCIVFCLWFTMNVTFVGFMITATGLTGNKYVNFFLLTLAELPAYTVDFFIAKRFGRRRPLIVLFFAGGVACLLLAFVPPRTASGTDLTVFILILAMVGKYFANSTFEVTILMGAEIFPTMLRNIATGSASVVGRLGGITAPFILDLQNTRSFLPMLIMGCLSLVSSSLVFMLPETMNRPLPETMEDADKLKSRHSTDRT